MNDTVNTTVETDTGQPAISVIIPVYRAENYLEPAIQSVLAQSFNDWELIIVDDSSSDNSLQLAHSFAQRDSRIHLISLKQSRPGAAGTPYCIGVQQARGRYITFWDSGDLYYPDYLEKLYGHSEIFSHVDVVMIGFQLHYLDKNKRQLCHSDATSWRYLLSPKLDRKRQKMKVRYVQMQQICSCTRHRNNDQAWSHKLAFHLLHGLSATPRRKLYRREFLLQNHILSSEDKHFFEDSPLHWVVCAQANNILFCDTIAYQHNIKRKEQSADDKVEKQIHAGLLQSEQILNYLLHAIEHQQLGTKAEFYLLLWMRNLLYTFCHGFRPGNLKQRQVLYLETAAMLKRRIYQSPLLAKALQPLHKLKFADRYHLHLNPLEATAWYFLVSRTLKVQAGERCDKLTKSFLALLHFPLTNYANALRERLLYFISKLC